MKPYKIPKWKKGIGKKAFPKFKKMSVSKIKL